MEALLSFLFWTGITFLMMRYGRRPRPIGQLWRLRPSAGPEKEDCRELRWVPPAKNVDPVCGTIVTTEKAKPSVYAGNVHYFCSRECREIFEAAPHFYVGNGAAGQRTPERSPA